VSIRIRLQKGISDTPLSESLPVSGHVLYPESNRSEWAIVAVDKPVCVEGVTVDLLWLRPAISGVQIGDPTVIPAHVAIVTGVGNAEGHPVYRLGKVLGQVVCSAE
jgi:hypothetical protein